MMLMSTAVLCLLFAVVSWRGTAANASVHSGDDNHTYTIPHKQHKDLCQPTNFHLSPASSVFIYGWVSPQFKRHVIDMFLSFTMPFQCENTHSIHIQYGRNQDDDESVYLLDDLDTIQFSFHEHIGMMAHQSSWIFHGRMQHMNVSTSYWYQIVIQNNGKPNVNGTTIVGDKIVFTTPPALGMPTSIAVVADWGQSVSGIQTMKTIQDAIDTIEATTAEERSKGEHHRNDKDKMASSLVHLLRHTTGTSKEEHLGTHNHQVHISSSKGPHPPTSLPRPPISALLIVGDLSYANGYLPSWETWLSKMQPLFERLPILVAAGNHELECDAKTHQIFQAYQHYFRTPQYTPPTKWEPVPWSERAHCTHPASELWSIYEGGNSYYDYRQGLVHVIVLNSYTDTSVGSPQYNWLEHVLSEKVNRTITPWLLVAFHNPLHTTFRGHNHDMNPTQMQEHMEPLFWHYLVNIVVSGHQHAYVRSHPLHGATVVKQGPIYYTVGTGGDSHSLGPLHKNDDWVASRDHTTFGAMQLQFVNATHAYSERLLNDGNHQHQHKKQETHLKDPTWIVNYYYSTIQQHQEAKQQQPE